MYKHPRDVIDVLDEQVRSTAFPPDIKILVVFGYPRSDIGKGTLVSHLLAMLDEPNVIKFDGLLNTNIDGRFTAADHDDFGLYLAQNPAIKITEQNHLLGGTLLRNFINEFGETNERLTLIPHLQHFFRVQLQRQWQALGQPKSLIIEMGGTPDDIEAGYAVAAIRDIKAELGVQCQILLLTELGHNNIFVKSKVAQRGVGELVSRGIVPDIIMAREPYLEKPVSVSERLHFEIQMQERIAERTGIKFNNVISVPYFKGPKRAPYRKFLEANLLPLLQKPQQHTSVLIGTTDQPEIEEWDTLLGAHVNLVNPTVLGIDIDVNRDSSSLARSSHERARSFSRASGLPTIAAKIGLHINALDGKPGGNIRTWGGELPATVNNQELFDRLRSQIEPLEDTSCYLERSVTLALPNGEEYHFRHRNYGTIDKNNFARGYQPGQYPIGLVFKYDQYNATWAEMTPQQKRRARLEVTDRILNWMGDIVSVKR